MDKKAAVEVFERQRSIYAVMNPNNDEQFTIADCGKYYRCRAVGERLILRFFDLGNR